MLLSIIIINYNTTKHLRECLSSINQHLSFMEKEIIVADNNSPDRDIELLAKEMTDVRFLFRKSNDGFGTACNDAAEVSTGKYLLFLNPDVKLIDDSIKLLIDGMEKDPEAGIYSGLLTDSDNEPIYCFNKFPDIEWEFYQFIGIGYEKRIKKLLSRNEIKEGRQFAVDWFHGAFLLLSRKDFLSVSGFDNKYFMYSEDVELCYRIKTELKKKNICFPNVRIYHHTKSSLEQESTDNIFIFHMHRGRLLFIKNYGLTKKYIIYTLGLSSVIIRLLSVPFWHKYKGGKKNKFRQLAKIMRLYLDKDYLNTSKYEYINK